MKGELTQEQLREFTDNFAKAFRENYNKALRSGAVGEDDIQDQPFILVRGSPGLNGAVLGAECYLLRAPGWSI